MCYTYRAMQSSKSQAERSDSNVVERVRQEGVENPSSYCPVCSARLESRKCKLLCRICGYYMSCSDYY